MWVGGVRRRPVIRVIDEFDLPCAECGHDLVRTTVEGRGSGDAVTVADCPNCDSRYYPRGALKRL